ncbi:MAG: DMT family transporter [Rhizobiales bacterium]|nr:DMT family transporter [Hyphomicrobiales bacterium]
MTAAADPVSVPGEDRRGLLKGIGLLLLAMIVLPAQDAVAKYISVSVSPGQITWARFLLQTVFMLPLLVLFQGWGGLVPNRLWPNLLRGALIAGSSTLFFIAIKFMPIADALAIFFVEPFILTVLSAVFDKEHVGWRRRIAVAAGFLGVLMVVRPSYAVFGAISLVPAAAGCLFAVYALLNRRLSSYDTPLTMQFTAGLSAFVILTFCLLFGWLGEWPEFRPSSLDGRELSFLLLMGVFGTSGHLFFVQAARRVPSSVVAPIQYVEIVFAALFGLMIFGDFPDAWKWVGIAVIVASGAYVFWRESRRG